MVHGEARTTMIAFPSVLGFESLISLAYRSIKITHQYSFRHAPRCSREAVGNMWHLMAAVGHAWILHSCYCTDDPVRPRETIIESHRRASNVQ
jgi:hypothetical protein